MSWDMFNIVRDHLVSHVFGSTTLVSIFLLIVLTVFLLSLRTPIIPAIFMMIIAVFGLASSGWFDVSWAIPAVFVVLALIYAFIMNAMVKD